MEHLRIEYQTGIGEGYTETHDPNNLRFEIEVAPAKMQQRIRMELMEESYRSKEKHPWRPGSRGRDLQEKRTFVPGARGIFRFIKERTTRRLAACTWPLQAVI